MGFCPKMTHPSVKIRNRETPLHTHQDVTVFKTKTQRQRLARVGRDAGSLDPVCLAVGVQNAPLLRKSACCSPKEN